MTIADAADAMGTSQLQRFFAGTVLVNDRRDHTAEVVEFQFAPLARDDRNAGVAEQTPVLHAVENILARHTALFR